MSTKKIPMITHTNQAFLQKISACGLQEVVVKPKNIPLPFKCQGVKSALDSFGWLT
jgi:hypothetical protein